MEIKWILAFSIAALSDLIDYVGGFIPVMGDIVDVITLPILFFILQEPLVLAGAIELIPGVDFVPTWIGVVAFSYIKKKRDK